MIANRVTAQNEGRELFEKINLVVKKFLKFGMEYLGDIPQDEQVSKAIIRQKPVVLSAPDSGAGKALRKLATKLAGASVPPPDERKGIAQLSQNYVNVFDGATKFFRRTAFWQSDQDDKLAEKERVSGRYYDNEKAFDRTKG